MLSPRSEVNFTLLRCFHFVDFTPYLKPETLKLHVVDFTLLAKNVTLFRVTGESAQGLGGGGEAACERAPRLKPGASSTRTRSE